jgi:hypothetical protein
METTTTNPRPDFCTDEHLEFLDDLRRSSRTNMFGARPWLMNAFPELSGDEARAILKFWRNDDTRHGERAGGAA